MAIPKKPAGILIRAPYVWDETQGEFVALEKVNGGLLVTDSNFAASQIANDRKTIAVAATAERLVATTTPCLYIRLTALQNAGIVYYGYTSGNTTTSKGIPMTPFSSQWVIIDDAHDLWINAANAGDGFAYEIYAA